MSFHPGGPGLQSQLPLYSFIQQISKCLYNAHYLCVLIMCGHCLAVVMSVWPRPLGPQRVVVRSGSPAALPVLV